MVFASHSFILFLIFCLSLYWLASKVNLASGKYVIIGFSLAFYAYWKPAYLLILLASILANFLLARRIVAVRDQHLAKTLLAIGVAGNLLTLGYFKYFAFLISTWNGFAGAPLPVPEILLPIGISFFTFQQIGFLVDFHRGRVAAPSFVDYFFIVSFFPHSIAGPIVRIADLLPQLIGRTVWRLRGDQLAIGFAIFAMGLFKKSVLVDPIAQYVDAMYEAAARGLAMGFVDGWSAAIGYGFQIYFDFSGYSDMAIGLGLLFGVRLPVNFFSPYKSASVREFWRRWHISLSRFLRDYLFIPLGGSRHGLARTVAALMVTMALGGMWHGANWTFMVWGALHGAYLSINHLARAAGLGRKLPAGLGKLTTPLGVVATFLAVSFAWVFFRADSIASALVLAKAMTGFSGWHSIAPSQLYLTLPFYFLIVWAMPNTMQLFRRFEPALGLTEFFKTAVATRLERRLAFGFTLGWAVAVAVIFIVAWLAISNLSPFIYFQF